jgi:integrase
MDECRRPSTWKLYKGHWDRFKAFCAVHGKSNLPAAVSTVLAFMQENLEKSGSVQNNIAISASVSAFHEKGGFVSPCSDKMVRNFVTGVKKTRSAPVTRKQPMTKEIVRRFITHCLSTDLYSEKAVKSVKLWRATMFELLAFLGMARLDDLLNVKISDITFSPTHVSVFCPKRKNDSLNRGHSLVLQVSDTVFCPKKLLEKYVNKLSGGGPRYRGPLLPFLQQDKVLGKPATYTQIRNVQYGVLAELKLDPKLFGCHSGRRGSCKESKKAGMSERQVQIAGGWSENSSTPEIYNDNHEHSAKFAVSAALVL